MGCLFSCFQDNYKYENLELSKSLSINNYSEDEDWGYDTDYYSNFLERVHRRRLYTYD